MATLNLQEAHDLVVRALVKSGANDAMAQATARGLVRADAQGLASHGLSRVTQYATHLRNGRANGAAIPTVTKRKGGALVVDAQQGLAFVACELAVKEAVNTAQTQGVCFVGVVNSHHCGVVVDHLRAAASAGMVAIGFANSPAAMPAAGGKHPIFGTNPVAAVFPRQGHDPLMIDLSLSEVARGKLMVAAKEGKSIPLGWALDKDGNPTTDPKAGMEGSMLPFGTGDASALGSISSPKGSMLALMVELMVTAVIGAQFGYEASSFFVDEGNAPRIGQAFIVIDPGALAGSESYFARMETIIAEMLVDDGVRLAGARRLALERKASVSGITVPDTLKAQIEAFAA